MCLTVTASLKPTLAPKAAGGKLPKALQTLCDAGKDLTKFTEADLIKLTAEQKISIFSAMRHALNKPGMEAKLKEYQGCNNDTERRKAQVHLLSQSHNRSS